MIRKGFKADWKWPQQSQNLFLSDKDQPVGHKGARRWRTDLPLSRAVILYPESLSGSICLVHCPSVSHRALDGEFSLCWETEASSFYIDRVAGLCEIRGHKAGSNRKTSLIIKDGRESFSL